MVSNGLDDLVMCRVVHLEGWNSICHLLAAEFILSAHNVVYVLCTPGRAPAPVQILGGLRPDLARLFHAPTRMTSSRCFMLHKTVHALWNLYGIPYKNRTEKEEETVTQLGNS